MLKLARWKSFKGRSTWLPSYQRYVYLHWSCVEYLYVLNSLAPLTWGLGREGEEEAIFIGSLLQCLGKVLILSTCEKGGVWALEVNFKPFWMFTLSLF